MAERNRIERIGKKAEELEAPPLAQRIGEVLGQGARAYKQGVDATRNTMFDAAGTLANRGVQALTGAGQTVSNVGRSAIAGFTGEAPILLGQEDASRPLPAVAGAPKPRPNVRGGEPMVKSMGIPRVQAPTPAATSTPASPVAPVATATPSLRPGDPNTFTGRNGTVAVSPGVSPTAAAVAPAYTMPAAAAPALSAQPAVYGARQTSPASLESLTGAPSRDEALRRFRHDMSSSMLGKDEKRQIAANFGAMLQSVAAGQNQQAAIGAQGQNQLAAGQQQANAAMLQGNARNATQLEAANIAGRKAPQLITGADGTGYSLSFDGSAPVLSPVMGADGKPLKLPNATRDYGQEAEYNLFAQLMQGQVDPLTGAQLPNAAQNVLQTMQEFKAGKAGETQAQSPPPPPKAGAVIDGMRFKGGDPGDKANWEKV